MQQESIPIPDFDKLFEDLEHPNPNINQNAYRNMISFWPEQSIPRLIGNMRMDDDNLRRKSLIAISAFGGVAIDPLAELFFSTKAIIVRTTCIKAFAMILYRERLETFPDALLDVIENAISDDSPQVILCLVSLLRNMQKYGLSKLMSMVNDSNILRAKAAITALSEFRDEEAYICLKKIYEDQSNDAFLRLASREAMDARFDCI